MNKTTLDDLSLFGGKPLFNSVRPVGQLTAPQFDLFLSFLKMTRFYQNSSVRLINEKLEERLSEIHGVENCITFASASLALIILMETLADGRHGEVIMPAFTYAGLPHLAQWAGQNPCFCDVDSLTHTLDPSRVEAAISKDTTSILAVHQVNSPCHIDELEALAASAKIPVFYDSVHGIYCTYKGKPIGCFGVAEVFSLHATKLLNGFEGGYITTNSKELADILCQKRDQGFSSSGKVEVLGLNARLNEIHAACALSCIDELPRIAERNHQRLFAYDGNFKDIAGLSWIEYNDKGERMNYEFALLVVDPSWPISRDRIVNLMRAENALARPYYSPPVHLSTHCPDFIDPPKLPVTEELAKNIIQMPVGELVSFADIAALGDFFRFIHANADEINARLNKEESKA